MRDKEGGGRALQPKTPKKTRSATLQRTAPRGFLGFHELLLNRRQRERRSGELSGRRRIFLWLGRVAADGTGSADVTERCRLAERNSLDRLWSVAYDKLQNWMNASA